jgi:hypothetical protein
MVDELNSSSNSSSLDNQLATMNNNPLVLLNSPISTNLTRTNYLAWQCQITTLLHGYGHYKFVDPNFPPQTIISSTGQVEINPTYLQWRKQDNFFLVGFIPPYQNLFSVRPLLLPPLLLFEITFRNHSPPVADPGFHPRVGIITYKN